MPDRKPPDGGSLYRGPSGAPRDKRERERDRAREQGGDRAAAPESAREAGPRHAPVRAVETHHASEAAPPKPPQEQRMYGLNACLALFEDALQEGNTPDHCAHGLGDAVVAPQVVGIGVD